MHHAAVPRQSLTLFCICKVTTYYGDLTHTEALQRQLKGRHFALDWVRASLLCSPMLLLPVMLLPPQNKAPQPLELRMHSLRGVRSKLPPGYYTLRVTVYDHMSGASLLR